MNNEIIKSEMLDKKYGDNIHFLEFNEDVQTGIVNPLLNARDKDEKYCVVLGLMVPQGFDGEWKPIRDYITTDDIKTEENDREQEYQNIYSFLRGEERIKRNSNMM